VTTKIEYPDGKVSRRIFGPTKEKQQEDKKILHDNVCYSCYFINMTIKCRIGRAEQMAYIGEVLNAYKITAGGSQ
jgi:hypothetical protein